MSIKFQYPVKKFAEAFAVLNPNTDIDVFDENIYIDLHSVRSEKFLTKIKGQLGVRDGRVEEIPGSFAKILFTGHRGSGKSVELERLTRDIDGLYFTIYIHIERELVKLSAVEPEDLYQLIFIKLLEKLDEKQISYNLKSFQNIINLWYDEKIFEDTEATQYTAQAGAGAAIGASFFVAKLKAFLKSVITSDSKSTEIIRRKIKANISDIISRLNVELLQLKEAIQQKGHAGFLFVFDGTEKLDYELSKKIFVYDAPILNQINANFIFASPIVGLHDIKTSRAYFQSYMLPMVKLTHESIPVLKKIITSRVDEDTFFETGVLDCIVKKSGGSIRQLLEITYNAILSSNYEKVTMEVLKDTFKDLGLSFYRKLDGDHKALLMNNNGDFDFGNEKIQEMLFSLVLLVENGDTIINPLLIPYINGTKNFLCD